MGRKVYFLSAILFFIVFTTSAQSGEVRGQIIEKGGNEGVPFASVAALQNGNQVAATSSRAWRRNGQPIKT